FGADNVLVIPYELLRNEPSLFLKNLSEFLSLPEIKSKESNRENRQNISLNDFQIQVIRAANVLGSDSSLTPHKTFLHKIGRLFVKLVKNHGSNVLTVKVDSQFKQNVENMVEDYFVESNVRLSKYISRDISELGYKTK
ncbi:MAG: hypothetical protein KUG78_21595, partial [Kangiellaceae bacterium]|nr:hypothetical protein [Kangiellaceae bacterium]